MEEMEILKAEMRQMKEEMGKLKKRGISIGISENEFD